MKKYSIIYGKNAVLKCPAVCQEMRWQRILLVCGKTSFEASGAAAILSRFNHTVSVKCWSDFSTNPDSQDLIRGLSIVKNFKPDAILAIGGGSVIDIAKLFCAYIDLDNEEIIAAIKANKKIVSRRIGLCVVPTTSGSGSEATHFAVVYDGNTKYSITGPALYPDKVILDPMLSLTGSKYQRATSGIDAICQSIESLWAVGATRKSQIYARRALTMLLKHIVVFVNNPTVKAACGMTIGSHLAGRAINISKTTAAHALSYAITKQYGISHGHAVALTLGQFIYAHAITNHLSEGVSPENHSKAISFIVRALGAADGLEAAKHFEHLLDEIGLESHLSQIGVRDSVAREALVSAVNIERLNNNPVFFGHKGILAIIEGAS